MEGDKYVVQPKLSVPYSAFQTKEELSSGVKRLMYLERDRETI